MFIYTVVHFGTIFLSIPRSSKWSHSFRLCDQSFVRISLSLMSCFMSVCCRGVPECLWVQDAGWSGKRTVRPRFWCLLCLWVNIHHFTSSAGSSIFTVVLQTNHVSVRPRILEIPGSRPGFWQILGCFQKIQQTVRPALFFHSFIPSACAECDYSLPFSGASSIPLCYGPFPSILFHQLFFHPLSPYLAIYFSVLLFPNSYTILFWEFYFLQFSVHVQTIVIYAALLFVPTCLRLFGWNSILKISTWRGFALVSVMEVDVVKGLLRLLAYSMRTAAAQWLRWCATNRKIAGSIPAGVIGIFHWHILPIAQWPGGRLSP